MSMLLIKRMTSNFPTLSAADYEEVEDSDVRAKDVVPYFCPNGHDFLIGRTVFSKRPQVFFECPDCTALAASDPNVFDTHHKPATEGN